MRRTPARHTNSRSYIPTEDVAVRLASVHCPGVECGEEKHGWLVFSPLLALATYLDHVHHVQCACRCSVLAWHWQRTWTGVGYASKRNTADPRKAHKLAVTVLISSPMCASGKNRIIVAGIKTCCTAVTWTGVVWSKTTWHCFFWQLLYHGHARLVHLRVLVILLQTPYGLLPQVKRQHFIEWRNDLGLGSAACPRAAPPADL